MKKPSIIIAIAIFVLAVQLSAQQTQKLVILHTNDTHSQVEPTDKNQSSNANMGGYARRMGLIQKIRAEEKNVLLVDAGDYWQGTPYFNFFNGHVEIDALNRMKYDAVGLGNHEFDNGIDSLAGALRKAVFPIVSANYDVKNTLLKGLVQPYIITYRDGLKIGIFGLGVNPDGLIFEKNYAGMKYYDPVKTAKKTACKLKKLKKCDVIICLSHLGSDSTEIAINDFKLAKKTRYIDVIIGGHSHTMLENTRTNNADGKPVIIAQMAKSGLFLGRIDLEIVKK